MEITEDATTRSLRRQTTPTPAPTHPSIAFVVPCEHVGEEDDKKKKASVLRSSTTTVDHWGISCANPLGIGALPPALGKSQATPTHFLQSPYVHGCSRNLVGVAFLQARQRKLGPWRAFLLTPPANLPFAHLWGAVSPPLLNRREGGEEGGKVTEVALDAGHARMDPSTITCIVWFALIGTQTPPCPPEKAPVAAPRIARRNARASVARHALAVRSHALMSSQANCVGPRLLGAFVLPRQAMMARMV